MIVINSNFESFFNPFSTQLSQRQQRIPIEILLTKGSQKTFGYKLGSQKLLSVIFSWSSREDLSSSQEEVESKHVLFSDTQLLRQSGAFLTQRNKNKDSVELKSRELETGIFT